MNLRLTAAPPGQRRLYRARRGRVLGGVAAGLSEHLGLPLVLVRAGFIVLAGLGGAGVLIYGVLWVVVPEADADDAAQGSPGAPADIVQLVALVALGLAVALFATEWGLGVSGVLWPLVLGGIGVALVWQQAEGGGRRWPQGWSGMVGGPGPIGRRQRSAAVARLAGGVVLLGLGLAGFLVTQGQLRNARAGLASTAVVVAGLALITGPWWLHTARELAAERRARIRAQEREEIAAHVHDSVLHTLALIQRNSEDPRAVARLARSQERELRTWLYRPSPTAEGETLEAALERVAAEVEANHNVRVDVVVVGSVDVSERLTPVVLAAREALVNAAKSSGVDNVSVYAEVEPNQVTVFVRDRGRGFDLDAVPEDRRGISGSIVGRMARSGGTATVRTAPKEGTEVELVMQIPSNGRVT